MTESRTSLRIMSYNIRHGVGNLPEQPRSFADMDLSRIVAVIRQAAPDIVGLQEVDRGQSRSDGVDQPAWLADQLDMHVCYGANVEMDGGEYGTAILSRFPITNAVNTLLPVFDRREPRGLLEARVDVAGVGAVLVANTHLQVGGPGYEDAAVRERAEQARVIAGRLHAANAPVILTGDFNAQPGAQELAPFDVYQDAWLAAGHEGPGYTIPTSPVEEPTQRIDMIYAGRSWSVISCRVEVTEVTRMASDHYPVVAELTLGDS